METSYPVYDVDRHDYTSECEPIGKASSEADALALLRLWFADTGADPPQAVELNDRDWRGTQLWAYWPIWENRE